nr:hypothetical protein [Planctomycetota bacterium]
MTTSEPLAAAVAVLAVPALAATVLGASGGGLASWQAVIIATALCAAVALALLDIWRDRQRARRRADDGARAHDAADRQRLELVAQLAAGLGHELGQPLSAARVGIEGLHYLRQLGREPSPEHVTRTLSQVGMSLVSMTQTIEHLRALAAREEAAPLQRVDLAAAVAAVLAERDQWLRYQDIAIVWQQPTAPVMALSEPAGLRLILVNLLRNAAEAVAGQGAERRQVRVTVGPGPVIAVHDSGPGIAPDHLARLFDPFFTTKGGSARGIGLSLAAASA